MPTEDYIFLPAAQTEELCDRLIAARAGTGIKGMGLRQTGPGDVKLYPMANGASIDSVTPINNTLKCPGSPGCPS